MDGSSPSNTEKANEDKQRCNGQGKMIQRRSREGLCLGERREMPKVTTGIAAVVSRNHWNDAYVIHLVTVTQITSSGDALRIRRRLPVAINMGVSARLDPVDLVSCNGCFFRLNHCWLSPPTLQAAISPK